MTIYIYPNNEPQSAFDAHPTFVCPHCGTKSGMTAISIPRYEYLARFRPSKVGICYRCDSCNAPVFLTYGVVGIGNPATLSESFEQIQRPRESYELKYLPAEVREDFEEALTCYSQACWNAFAAMCRRTLQSSATALGTEGSSKVEAQVKDLREMELIDDEGFDQLKQIMLSGHDGAHPHLPKLSPDRATVLLELVKDALYQMFVRQAKIKEAARLRQEAQTRK